MTDRIRRFVVVVAALLLAATVASAQVATSGRLTGLVTDATQAAVPGAQVTLVEATTGTTITTQSGATGVFTIANLKPGTYTVRVGSVGFKTKEYRNVKVTVGETYTLNAMLEVGEVQSTVVVEAGAEVLKTSETSVTSTISGKSIQQLPFTSRDALDLAILMPGAQTTGRPRASSFNGLPKGALNITLDGINAQSNFLKSSDGFFTLIRPRVDTIEEFSISTAAQGAEQASEGAVQMRFETKRGSNDYHGSAWWYHRNDFLNSNYYFNNLSGLPRQRQRLNQFGYSVGGPIWKDKVFFFHAFDFYRKPDSRSRTRTILTDEATQGVFRYSTATEINDTSMGAPPPVPLPAWSDCGPGAGPGSTPLDLPPGTICTGDLMAMAAANALPSLFDGTLTGLLQQINGVVGQAGVGLLPAPSLFQRSIRFTNFGAGNRWFPDFRFDWNITNNHQFSAIYHYAKFSSTPDFLNSRDPRYPIAGFENNIGSQISNRNNITAQWRYNITPTQSNMFIIGVVSAPVAFFPDMDPTLYPMIDTNLGPIRVRPDLDLVTDPFNGFGRFPRNVGQIQANDTFSWTLGRHSMSFGFSSTHIFGKHLDDDAAVGFLGTSVISSDSAVQGVFVSSNLPGTGSTDRSNARVLYAMLTGRVNAYSALVYVDPQAQAFVTGSPLFREYRQNEFGFFGTDSWRITPNFTLTYGLRWEYQASAYAKTDIFFRPVGGPDGVYGISGPGNLFSPGTLAGSAPVLQQAGKGKWYNNDMNNWAPSIGLAWTPSGIDHPWYNAIFGGPNKTVFRGGYSISYTREGTNNWLTRASNNGGFQGSQFANAGSEFAPGTFFVDNLINGGQQLNAVSQNPSSFVNSFAVSALAGDVTSDIARNLQVPYVQSWTFGIQREITPSTVLEVRYVGNHAPNLWRGTELNEVNIFENGFLQEFLAAQSNLAICRANSAACIAAQSGAGASTTTADNFANWGLAGQVNLPIMTQIFTGSMTTGSQTDSDFRSGSRVGDLDDGQAGSFAEALAFSTTFNNNMINSTLPGDGLPANFFLVNPDARNGQAAILRNGARSNYHALQIEVRRRMSRGVQINANYSWSKSLTTMQETSSTNFDGVDTLRNTRRNYNPAPFDLRHQFKFQGIWELPFGPGRRWSSDHGWLNRIIEGWEISSILRWQSGRVSQLTGGLGGTFNGNDGGIEFVGITPRQLQEQAKVRQLPTGEVFYFPSNLIGSNGRADPSMLRPCATPGEFCQRVFIYGPEFFRPDINVVKTTRITEQVNIQFRAEFLNAFNNINFLYGGSAADSTTGQSLRSTSFGRITNAYQDTSTTDDPGGRIIQFVIRINF